VKSSFSSPGHEVWPVNDLCRPHACILVVSLTVKSSFCDRSIVKFFFFSGV
jgi:hypothetical protein